MHDWKWHAIYNDDTSLEERDDIGFAAIDQSKLKIFVVSSTKDPTKQFAVHIKEGMRPIFFRRIRNLTINDLDTIPVEYVNEKGEINPTITFATVLGWQSTINGKNTKNMVWLMYDGSVAITDRDIDELEENK